MTTPEQTRITLSQFMGAMHANVLGKAHGGEIMKLVDSAAGVAAGRFSSGPAVTASMDSMNFLAPVRVGDVLHVMAQVNWSGRSSMEVGVRAEAERWDEVTDRVHVATAYLVMVAVDHEGGKRRVPELELPTEEDRRRFTEAEERRAHRLREREADMRREARHDTGEGSA